MRKSQYTMKDVAAMAGFSPIKDDENLVDIGQNKLGTIYGTIIPPGMYSYGQTIHGFRNKKTVILEDVADRSKKFEVNEIDLRIIIHKRQNKN